LVTPEDRPLSWFSVRLPRFAVIGAVAVVVVAGAFYVFDRPATETPAAPAAPAAPARQTASVPRADAPDPDATPDEAVSDRAFHLIGQARRLADRGKFEEANAKLAEAEKAVPGLSETADARRKIAELATPEGRLAIQLARARTALGSDDYAAAEKELADAEKLKPGAPEIAALRQEMQAAQQKEAKRSSQVAEQLAAMRASIARKDIAGADRAFNEASRIDILDPALDQARVELAHAHDAARDKN
jgi:tetratricopeptide (TPR) repeat protein